MGVTQTREKILNCTVELIKERNGNVEDVTIRTIARRANIGVGLTNHYFKSKDLLIEECVDTIFKDLLTAFISSPEKMGGFDTAPTDAVTHAAQNIMHFFLENEALAKVALLLDNKKPGVDDYTSKLTNAFAYCMVDRKKLEDMLSNDRMTDKMKQQFRDHFISEQKRKAFMITASIKEAFLRKDYLRDALGIDLTNPVQCDEYVEEFVELLM